jgi:hypothetical protein
MRALLVRVSEGDARAYPIAAGYRYGIYLERDAPLPKNRRVNLVVYRVPAQTTAPLGRIPDALLLELAQAAARPEAAPEVVARLPYWSSVEADGQPVELPDDTAAEPLVVLPPSLVGGDGHFLEPPEAFTPVPAAASTVAQGDTPPEDSPGRGRKGTP